MDRGIEKKRREERREEKSGEGEEGENEWRGEGSGGPAVERELKAHMRAREEKIKRNHEKDIHWENRAQNLQEWMETSEEKVREREKESLTRERERERE